jgi:putative aldouronate transport system permease protein
LPGIAPTIVILLILTMGSLFAVATDKILLLYTPLTYETGDVIGTYVYRKGIRGGDYSFSTAVGLAQTVVNFTLLIVVNNVSKRVSEVSLW